MAGVRRFRVDGAGSADPEAAGEYEFALARPRRVLSCDQLLRPDSVRSADRSVQVSRFRDAVLPEIIMTAGSGGYVCRVLHATRLVLRLSVRLVVCRILSPGAGTHSLPYRRIWARRPLNFVGPRWRFEVTGPEGGDDDHARLFGHPAVWIDRRSAVTAGVWPTTIC